MLFVAASLIGLVDIWRHRRNASLTGILAAVVGVVGTLVTGAKDTEQAFTEFEYWRFGGWAALGAALIVLVSVLVAVLLDKQPRQDSGPSPSKVSEQPEDTGE